MLPTARVQIRRMCNDNKPAVNVGSLFSGIGGLELGLERAGMRTVFQVESDAYARAVLAKHWPNVRRFDDVRTVGAHNLPPCDVLCGGFPCQDISNAGKRAGIEGARSGLWSEFARIIREIRPRYVLVENVSALVGRGLDRVLRDLAALGFDAEWTCLRASDVGAPHRRERLFLVAYAVGQGKLQPEGCLGQLRGRAGDRSQSLSDADRARLEGLGLSGAIGNGNSWPPEPDVGRVAHGISSRVDRLRCLGNAVVPQVAEVVGRLIIAQYS